MEREDSGDSCGCKCASIPGFCFKPSDEILVGYYLRQKVEGRPLSCNRYVAEFKIYDDHLMPWEILKDDDHHWITSSSSSNSSNKIKKTIYVFTELCKKKTRVGRKSGCGSWTGQNTRVVQNVAGDIIGYKKLLTFYRDNEKKKKKKIVDKEHGHWNMHEYSLIGIDNYVICKIMKEVEISSRGSTDQVVPVPDVIVAKDTNPVENMNALLGDHDKQLGGGDLDDQPLNQSGADWDENGWKAELDKELGFDISDDKSDEQCFDDNGEFSDRDLINGWTTKLYKNGAENLAQDEISDDTSADVVQKLPILAVMNEPPKVQSVLNVYVEEEAVLPVQELAVDVIEISDYDDDDDSIQELPMIGAADDDKMAPNNNPHDDLSDFLTYIAEMDGNVEESPFVPWEDLEQVSNDFANFETTVEHGLDAMQDFDIINLGDAEANGSIFEVQLRKRMRTDVNDFKKFSSRKKQRIFKGILSRHLQSLGINI